MYVGNDKVRGLHERTTNKQQMTNLIVLTCLVHFNISREIMIMLQLFFVQKRQIIACLEERLKMSSHVLNPNLSAIALIDDLMKSIPILGRQAFQKTSVILSSCGMFLSKFKDGIGPSANAILRRNGRRMHL